MKNILIAGPTGMVGELILEQSLDLPDIGNIAVLGRRSINLDNPLVQEVLVKDFTDYSRHETVFKNIDIAFFCIGVYTGQVSDAEFANITVDYAVAFAEAVKVHSPGATLCFLSGAGADRSEKSRMAFARYKGIAENKISALGLGAFYTFRPGYIYPVTSRKEPNIGYSIMRFLYPLIKLMGKNASIKSTELAQAMVQVGLNGASKEILENKDILEYI